MTCKQLSHNCPLWGEYEPLMFSFLSGWTSCWTNSRVQGMNYYMISTQSDYGMWLLIHGQASKALELNYRVTYMRHDDVIQWKYFPRYWPFVRGNHRSWVNSPHKGQWRGALMSSLICAWTNGWVNNRDLGDLRSHRTHYDVNELVINMGHHWIR